LNSLLSSVMNSLGPPRGNWRTLAPGKRLWTTLRPNWNIRPFAWRTWSWWLSMALTPQRRSSMCCREWWKPHKSNLVTSGMTSLSDCMSNVICFHYFLGKTFKKSTSIGKRARWPLGNSWNLSNTSGWGSSQRTSRSNGSLLNSRLKTNLSAKTPTWSKTDVPLPTVPIILMFIKLYKKFLWPFPSNCWADFTIGLQTLASPLVLTQQFDVSLHPLNPSLRVWQLEFTRCIFSWNPPAQRDCFLRSGMASSTKSPERLQLSLFKPIACVELGKVIVGRSVTAQLLLENEDDFEQNVLVEKISEKYKQKIE